MRVIADTVRTELHELRTSDAAGGLARRRLIEDIVRINRSASTDFLEAFSDHALKRYLQHLEFERVPRGRMARWVRPGDTAALNTAEPSL